MTSPQTSSAACIGASFAAAPDSAPGPAPGAQAALLAPQAPWRATMAASVLAYQAVAGLALAQWLLWSQRASPAQAAVFCALPLLLTVWLVWRAEPDGRQFMVQLFAAAMFGPLLLAFWAGGEVSVSGSAAWPFMLGGALLHGAALVAAVLGFGAYVTRVAPAPQVAPVETRLLRERLLSLGAAEVPADVEPGPSDGGGDSLVFQVHFADPARSHRITLRFDAARARVRVFERTGSRGARPVTASEASLRGPGDPSFDSTRPEARIIAGTAWQTTMIAPQRLAGIRLTLQGPQAMLPRPQARALDAEGVVTLLCAVVTGSGWAWQPGWRA